MNGVAYLDVGRRSDVPLTCIANNLGYSNGTINIIQFIVLLKLSPPVVL